MKNQPAGEQARDQYRHAGNLNRRISIHEKYSVNRQGFGPWIMSHYGLKAGDRILDIGCGTGSMWASGMNALPPGCRLTLTDLSPGMLDAARSTLAAYPNVTFQLADIQELPFEKDSFDAVTAHMMLYHVPDMDRGLGEVRRVLRPGGAFYCATYGEHGIMEFLSEALGEFGVRDPMNRRFTLQNGESLLRRHFSSVRRLDYEDALNVTRVEDLVDYLYSMASMAHLPEAARPGVTAALRGRMRDGALHVPKEYGMFICE